MTTELTHAVERVIHRKYGGEHGEVTLHWGDAAHGHTTLRILVDGETVARGEGADETEAAIRGVLSLYGVDDRWPEEGAVYSAWAIDGNACVVERRQGATAERKEIGRRALNDLGLFEHPSRWTQAQTAEAYGRGWSTVTAAEARRP